MDKKIWDEIAKGSPQAWFTHLNDWIEIESKWGVQSYSFIADDMGIIPLFLVKKKGFSYLTSGYKGWGGPAMIYTDVSKVYDMIDKLAEELKVDWVEIKLPSLIYSNSINPLIKYGYKDMSSKTSIIDLRFDEEILLKNIDKKCRYEIRKQEKLQSEIHVTEAKSLEDIKEYYKLHCDNYNRTNTAPNPIWYFEELWKRFYPEIIHFFFIEEDGKKVVAASVAMWKGKAMYLTGASLEEARDKGLNHYLQWNIIKGLHRAGLKYYEMGEIDDSTEKSRNLGRFKKSFGGNIYPIYKGIKIYRPFRYKLYNILKKVKSWLSKK